MLEDETWDRVPRQLDELSAETGYTLIAMEGQRPMSFSDGREHVQYLATQGYFVEVLPARRSKMILVKVWEYGDVEPSWDDVEGGVGPVLVFSFDTSAELQVYCESIVDELVRRHQYNDVYAAQLVNRMCTDMFTRHEDRLALLERKSPMQWAYAFANYKPAPTESLSMKSLRRFVTRRKD